MANPIFSAPTQTTNRDEIGRGTTIVLIMAQLSQRIARENMLHNAAAPDAPNTVAQSEERPAQGGHVSSIFQ
jgi:hypothetical protein